MPAASKRFTPALLALFIAIGGGAAHAQQSLRIENASSAGLQSATVEVLMTNTAPVEGFVIAITYDGSLVGVTDAGVAGTVTASTGAELVVAELLPAEDGFTLGVVLDMGSPFAGQTIGAGTAQAIANFEVTPVQVVTASTTTLLTFTDGLNSPPLDNLLVQGGNSVGAGNGLGLIDGEFTLLPPPPDALVIEDVTIPANGVGSARVLLSNSSGPVQGFVLAVEHDFGLSLEDIVIDDTVTEATGAEFVVPSIGENGGTLGVVLDFNSPFAGQTIEIGVDQHIASFVYSCQDPPVSPSPATQFGMRFVDGVLGNPALDNVIVVSGLSLSPGTTDGTATCNPVPLENTQFLCGVDNGFDAIGEPVGPPGGIVDVSLFYVDPDSDIQGYQIAMCLDEELSVVPGSFNVEGTISDAVGAEFVVSSADNSTTDGDGVEFTAGVLLDALPPFDNQCLPSTSIPLRIGTFRVEISEGAECDACYSMSFCDGIDASENVPLDNLIVVEYRSVTGFTTHDCSVCVTPDNTFVRGDCNTDVRVDIADVAKMLGRQFQGSHVTCIDACDSNDDGKADLADAVYLLNYLFRSGSSPRAPFPNRGLDSTPDNLTCDEGLSKCS